MRAPPRAASLRTPPRTPFRTPLRARHRPLSTETYEIRRPGQARNMLLRGLRRSLAANRVLIPCGPPLVWCVHDRRHLQCAPPAVGVFGRRTDALHTTCLFFVARRI